jgi:2-keto-4-pentenoate hydratase/2-oxohepta-3-ene-1,7-dioic acid hydratase in catechol pathway
MRTVVADGVSVAPGKIVCVGRNYLAHIREMGGSDSRSEPTIFIKPNSAIAQDSGNVTIPEDFGLLHHEVELCFMVSRTCKNVTEEDAGVSITAWGIGIDFTLRDKQSEAKKAGGPWTISKCFDGAAVFGEFMQPHRLFDPLDLQIKLTVNHELRQSASTKQMIFSPVDVLCYVSKFMTVDPGDIFMCGTPEGVREVVDGDLLKAEITDLPNLEFTVLRS